MFGKYLSSIPTVIPAQAGIHACMDAVVERRREQAAEGSEAGMLGRLRLLPACRNNASVVIPALREWII